MYLMEAYDDALRDILKHGIKKQDRTGVGSISIAGLQRKYRLDQDNYFPIVTGRKLFPKSVWAELLWFISGSTMNQDLEALGCKFWGKWCDESNPQYVALRKKWNYEKGCFGPIYGWQLRHFGADYIKYCELTQSLEVARQQTPPVGAGWSNWYVSPAAIQVMIDKVLDKGFDQLSWMVDILKNNPFGSEGRRCLFSLWNPKDLPKMVLPPCHYTFQMIPDGDGGLTGIMTQRSCDMPVGVPANIQFYSALTIMLAQQVGMVPRELVHNTNDAHIYLNQIEQVEEYLSRPKPDSPKLSINKAVDIFSYKVEDFMVTDYNPLEKIDMPVAV